MTRAMAWIWWVSVLTLYNTALAALFRSVREAVKDQPTVLWISEWGTLLTTGLWRGWVLGLDGIFLLSGSLLAPAPPGPVSGVQAVTRGALAGIRALVNGPLALWGQHVPFTAAPLSTPAGILQRGALWFHYDVSLTGIAIVWAAGWHLVSQWERARWRRRQAREAPSASSSATGSGTRPAYLRVVSAVSQETRSEEGEGE